jgi:hypothetical protein
MLLIKKITFNLFKFDEKIQTRDGSRQNGITYRGHIIQNRA